MSVDREALARSMRMWRHDLHAHPELSGRETRTARLVAEILRAHGVDEVFEGVGGTGVVGKIRRGASQRAIALRADMDALPIEERAGRPHASREAGVMHACGHDGHMAMLLGAAAILSDDGGFDGTVYVIFQPAEENGLGAAAMLDDGLLERFSFTEIYGLHNMPGVALGHMQTRGGPMMAAEDLFEIVIRGSGGHAARPHQSNDVLVAASEIVLALQSIVSRRIDPMEAAVVSATTLSTDGRRNILPSEARIAGDARSFTPETSRVIESSLREISAGIAAAHGATAELRYNREFIPLCNDRKLAQAMLDIARDEFGASAVAELAAPTTVSEDFAQYLRYVPGCFFFLGNGIDSAPLHTRDYDFDDRILPLGAAIHAAIARHRLAPDA